MENNVAFDNRNKQLVESGMPSKKMSRFRCYLCCGCILLLSAILLLAVLILILEPSFFHPMRYTFSYVESHEIPVPLRELAGEWVIELPNTPLFFEGDMKGWKNTRLVLYEDGTCEIHNLTLRMTVSQYGMFEEGPVRHDWTGKILKGFWQSSHYNVSRHNATGGLTHKSYVGIDIIGEKNIDRREEAKEKNIYAARFLVWKVNETYKLKMYEGGIPSDNERSGIILKRVE